MELTVGEIYRMAVVQRPLLGLVALLGFIQGYRNPRASECHFGSEKGFPIGRKGKGDGVEGR